MRGRLTTYCEYFAFKQTMSEEKWLAEVEQQIETFSVRHRFTYRRSKRQLAASFEIGCFLALTSFYERHATVELRQLKEGCYRYLTSPQGHPENFSYVALKIAGEGFELRQQVRVRSHLHPDIAFTPDIIVIRGSEKIESVFDAGYAYGKQRYAFVDSADVIAAHECKSLQPFPELFVSFIGMIKAAHAWIGSEGLITAKKGEGEHFAPSLFVGGSAKALHNRMAYAVQEVFPVNIVLGLHKGRWELRGRWNRLRCVKAPNENIA